MEEIAEEVITFYECLVTLQNTKYGNGNKRLRIEKVKVQNKKIIDQEQTYIDMFGNGAKMIMVFHQFIGHALSKSIDEQNTENLRLQKKLKKIKELEDTLNMGLPLMTPLTIQTPPLSISATATLLRSNRVVNHLNVIKSYIINGIYQI